MMLPDESVQTLKRAIAQLKDWGFNEADEDLVRQLQENAAAIVIEQIIKDMNIGVCPRSLVTVGGREACTDPDSLVISVEVFEDCYVSVDLCEAILHDAEFWESNRENYAVQLRRIADLVDAMDSQ